jgi:copper transporter 1
MDHTGMGMPSMSGAMMVPYLHFFGGDYLWINVWAPSSKGEIAAACVGLLIMAMLERLIAAMRTMFDLHWHIRSFPIYSSR